MTDKIYKIIIILLVIVIICMGIYIYGCQKDLTFQDYFNMDDDYISEWDNTTKVITVEKVVPLKFHQIYENVTTVITFYNNSEQIGKITVVNDTYNNELNLHAKTKLPEEPTEIKFHIEGGDLVDSDLEGLNYSRHFHLF